MVDKSSKHGLATSSPDSSQIPPAGSEVLSVMLTFIVVAAPASPSLAQNTIPLYADAS